MNGDRTLPQLADRAVAEGVPGVLLGISHGQDLQVASAGVARADGAFMARDAIIRIASITKPIVAAAAMTLVEDGTLTLASPVAEWLPELAHPGVLARPDGPVDDVVPANRPVTVEDLLTFRSGHGFPTDFSFPVVQLLFEQLRQGPPHPPTVPPPDEWMRRLADIPLLHQPGRGWTYNTGSDILGVLLARACGRPLPQVLRDRIFDPLGMVDTGFSVPAEQRGRLTDYWQPDGETGLSVQDFAADSEWVDEPAFPSGAGGLLSTLDDWWRFGRMLLGRGTLAGTQVLRPESVRAMLTDHLTDDQKHSGDLFLEGQGWGYGGTVDGDGPHEWNVSGRYGLIGGTGTAAHVIPSTDTVSILLTQVEMGGPTSTSLLNDFFDLASAAAPFGR